MKRNEAILLLKTSLESEKIERQRIATDLHDSVSSDLSAIRNYLVVLLKTELDSEKIELFKELKEGVETAIENTRLVSYKLIPPLLDNLGFVVALEDYFNKLNKDSSLKFTLISKDDRFKFDVAVSYELFRVVQEFTTNMLKYGSITSCTVALFIINEVAFLEIIDDGKSFDFNYEYTNSRGAGVKNISSRLKVIGATLLQREVFIGNHFVISLPIQIS